MLHYKPLKRTENVPGFQKHSVKSNKKRSFFLRKAKQKSFLLLFLVVDFLMKCSKGFAKVNREVFFKQYQSSLNSMHLHHSIMFKYPIILNYLFLYFCILPLKETPLGRFSKAGGGGRKGRGGREGKQKRNVKGRLLYPSKLWT